MVLAAALTLSACSLHISKNGVSGNFFGHSFSAEEHQLPQGFPSAVPIPANSRVLLGGGTSGGGTTGYDVGFAVHAPLASGVAAYQQQFRSAGYTISDVHAGTTSLSPSTTAGSNNNTTTTLTLTGSSFTATNPQWTVGVLAGTSSSVVSDVLKPGEFGLNITVVPTSEVTTTT